MPPVESDDGLGRGPRLVVLILGLALVVHSALVALWLAPSSPLRDVVGERRLASYVDPYFQQGDDTAGIGANRVDESLQVSALVRSSADEKPTITEWFDVTEVDVQSTLGQLGPSRAHQAARRLAVSLNAAMFAMNGPQREILSGVTVDQKMPEVLGELNRAGRDPNAVAQLGSVDEMARQYASLWIGARLSDQEVVRVRYRVGRRDAPSEADRDVALASVPFDWFVVGWRFPYRGTPDARAAFDDFVGAADG